MNNKLIYNGKEITYSNLQKHILNIINSNKNAIFFSDANYDFSIISIIYSFYYCIKYKNKTIVYITNINLLNNIISIFKNIIDDNIRIYNQLENINFDYKNYLFKNNSRIIITTNKYINNVNSLKPDIEFYNTNDIIYNFTYSSSAIRKIYNFKDKYKYIYTKFINDSYSFLKIKLN